MARRLLVCALAFVIVGGPLAGDLCEAVCALHTGHSIDAPAPASHHHHSAEVVSQVVSHTVQHHVPDAAATRASSRGALVPLRYECGALGALLAESSDLTRPPIVKAVVTAGSVTPSLVQLVPLSRMDRRDGPPPPIRSAAPLRI